MLYNTSQVLYLDLNNHNLAEKSTKPFDFSKIFQGKIPSDSNQLT